VRHFLEEAIACGDRYQREDKKEMDLTKAEEVTFTNTKQCHICEKALDRKAVRDHCHRCGKFRGAVHESCNLKLYEKNDVAVLFHNLRRYDGHLIMQELGIVAAERNMTVDCISKSLEDYLTFSVSLKTGRRRWKLRFLDSYAFMAASLETLASNLPRDKFNATNRFTTNTELLMKKGVYPYDYMNDAARFAEGQLPGKECFYNKLKMEHISSEAYTHAQNVWQAFDCRNLGDYHDLYLKTDVLLLTDVFESFRSFCKQHYGLDPIHYCTLPGFAWDALLKMNGVELELLHTVKNFRDVSD